MKALKDGTSKKFWQDGQRRKGTHRKENAQIKQRQIIVHSITLQGTINRSR